MTNSCPHSPPATPFWGWGKAGIFPRWLQLNQIRFKNHTGGDQLHPEHFRLNLFGQGRGGWGLIHTKSNPKCHSQFSRARPAEDTTDTPIKSHQPPLWPRSQVLQVIPYTAGQNTRLTQPFAMENSRKSPKSAGGGGSVSEIERISAGRSGLATCHEPTIPVSPNRGPVTNSHPREIQTEHIHL